MASGLDRTLHALADPNRRRVVELLREQPRRAGDLALALRLSFPAMSRHLRTMRESGLVVEDRDPLDSRVRIYQLNREPVDDLVKWLVQTEELWARQLRAFKFHVQKSRK